MGSIYKSPSGVFETRFGRIIKWKRRDIHKIRRQTSSTIGHGVLGWSRGATVMHQGCMGCYQLILTFFFLKWTLLLYVCLIDWRLIYFLTYKCLSANFYNKDTHKHVHFYSFCLQDSFWTFEHNFLPAACTPLKFTPWCRATLKFLVNLIKRSWQKIYKNVFRK